MNILVDTFRAVLHLMIEPVYQVVNKLHDMVHSDADHGY